MAKLSYKSAGVDIDLKQSLIPLFSRIARRTSGSDVVEGVGGFGAVVGLNGASRMRSPVLVAGTDSVGTKLKIAVAMDRHDTVGIDCVAMCVNDIICASAKPLFFLDYIGIGKLNKNIAVELVSGVARGCVEAGMSLVGGETAQLPGLYREGEYDLVGFAVGLAEKSRIPARSKIRPGDVLVGLGSNGMHSNGFSLARKVLLEHGGLKLGKRVPALKTTLGNELLRPTRIYAKVAGAMFDRFTVKGLANITGGGVPENLPRVLPRQVDAVLRRDSWPVPPIFKLIESVGKISRAEMDRTFNNGLGMIAVLPRREAADAVSFLKKRKQPAWIVGELRPGKGRVVFA